MNKNFTKEDIIKKHETNIKSAQGSFALAGILGIIYIVRYFITGNFDFYFSLSFPEVMLKLAHEGTFVKPLAYTFIAIFIAVYFFFAAMNAKNPKWLRYSLSLYLLDFLCLAGYLTVIIPKPIPSDSFIDVLIHLFIVLFLAVGVISHKKLNSNS